MSESCRTAFDLPALEERSRTLTAQSAEPEFWTRDGREGVLKELASVDARLEAWRKTQTEMGDLDVLDEMLRDGPDAELQSEFDRRAAGLRHALERASMDLLLNEEHDGANAIVTVHAGTGGLDAQDWAEMLLRMYLRWAEREGLKATVLEATNDEEAGIKSATVMVEGLHAYGLLKAERGVHRLVRLSPFNAAHNRQTSFASVLVSPEFPDDVDVDVRSEDLRVDTFRASGAGGQYVNRTDSAVRITHIPTGIVVTCQNERSQHMNRQVAMHVLKSKLYELALQERQDQLASVVGDKKESTWGSQIRSYVLHPYTLAKDHRTGCERGNVQAVLDGDIEPFTMEWLRMRAKGAL